MRCVRCGWPANRHIRYDGSCIEQPLCKGFVASWDDAVRLVNGEASKEDEEDARQLAALAAASAPEPKP